MEEDIEEFITWEQMMEEFEVENKKKNFRNWVNNHFNGYASYNAYHILTHPWEILLEWKNQVVWAWQRVFHSFDSRVIWSIDWYLAEKIPLWIKELKVKKQGIPTEMFDGLDHNENYEYSEDAWKIAQERWDNILDKIAEGFDSYMKLESHDFMDIKDEVKREKYKKELEDKYNEGFDLFRKHFGSLWD
jgi:hypothetical protein